MTKRAILLDAQLLCLLAVGLTGRSIISKHKKTRQFTSDDFDLLVSIVGTNAILLMPNVVTEASNHLMWHKPPEQERICRMLKHIVDGNGETYVASCAACEEKDYVRLGVADAAILACSANVRILTGDVALYLAARSKKLDVVNFNHERERFGTV